LDPSHVSQVLSETPVPFGSATKEKRSALAHFEPGNILIADPSRRAQLRPIHEHALATNERVHPFTRHFKEVVSEELRSLLPTADDKPKKEVTWDDFSAAWFKIIRRIVLGDAAREDESLTENLDDIRRQGNWGFAASVHQSRLQSFKDQVKHYLEHPGEESLVARISGGPGLDMESQVAHWLFAFEPAGMVTFRALALLGCQRDEQNKAINQPGFSRAVVLESVRLWPTTPAILRELTEDHQVGGRLLQKGTGVIIFAPFFHRDNQRLDFADRMATSIWTEDDAMSSTGLVPFSAGPAMCPAHNLVPLVGSLGVDEILSQATISLVQPTLNTLALPGTLDHYEIKLLLEKRKPAA